MSRILYKKHKIISKKEDIANEFNNFFTNVGPNLANNIPLIPKNDTTIYDYLEEIIKYIYLSLSIFIFSNEVEISSTKSKRASVVDMLDLNPY